MNLQIEFDLIIKLLKKQDNFIINELLENYSNELSFSIFSEKSEGISKNHILKIYEDRAEIEKFRNEDTFVIGYDYLIPSLRKTTQKYICISNFTNEKGSYIIFTDFEKNEFIGILKSKRTLSEIREKYKIHFEITGNYELDENIFLNGILKT